MNVDQKFYSSWGSGLAAFGILLATTIACGLAGSGSNLAGQRPTPTRTRLPTFTPTPFSTPIVAAIETGSPPVAQAEPLSAIAPTPSEAVDLTATPPPPTASGQTSDTEETPTVTPIPPSPVAPTSEPIATPVDPSPAAPANTPATVSTQTPVPPEPATTATTPSGSESSGWTFINIKDYPNPEEGTLLLYGNAVNNTGSTQIVTLISAAFYDSQGQAAADEENTFDYWSVEIVPPGGRLPFELSVYDVQDVADFNLNINADPDEQILRQDFDFLELSQMSEEGDVCLSGKIRNLGETLQEYVIIIATLYDDQNNVINFGSTYEFSTTELVGDQTSGFEICIDARNQEIADYDLQAWGR